MKTKVNEMDFQQEFPLDDSVTYLNHAAVAPWPIRTARAVQEFANQNAVYGSKRYLDWLKTENLLRQQLAQLINSSSTDEIALLKSTSEGLSVIAYGINFKPGDEVVISSEEFPSNRIVWESLASKGVKLIEVELDNEPEENLINACTSKTKLLSISSVQYGTGRVIDLNKLGEHCASTDTLFCVDAIQSIGAMPFDAQACKADFVVADGHKWMLGPEGLALFYCKKSTMPALQLNQYGWHMIEDAGNYTTKEWSVASSAKRFECGSPNMLGIHALSASLSLVLEVGIERISERVQALTQYVRTKVQERPALVLLSDGNALSGITTFQVTGMNSDTVYRELMDRSVMCACRGGGVRFSPHFYQDNTTIDRAFAILDDIIKQQ